MRKIGICTAILFAFAVLPVMANAKPLIEPIKLSDDMTLKIDGYSQNWYEIKEGEQGESEWFTLRLRGRLETKGPLGAFAEIDVLNLLDEVNRPKGADGENWLRQAWVSYDINDNWTLYLGRDFVSPKIVPALFLRETISFPKGSVFAFGSAYYATGLKVRGDLGKGWKMMAALTGDTGQNFDAGENWDHAVFSGQLKKEISSINLTPVLMTQVSDHFKRFGLGMLYEPTEKLYFRGAVTWADNKEDRDHFGGYLLAGLKPVWWANPYTQIDYRSLSSFGKKAEMTNTVWSTGLRVFLDKGKNLSLTGEYEKVLEPQEKDDRFLFRFQVRF